MDTFSLQIEADGTAVLEYPVPIGTRMLLSVELESGKWRSFRGRSRADWQGWRLHPVETRNLPTGATAKIEVYRAGDMGSSVETTAAGVVTRAA